MLPPSGHDGCCVVCWQHWLQPLLTSMFLTSLASSLPLYWTCGRQPCCCWGCHGGTRQWLPTLLL